MKKERFLIFTISVILLLGSIFLIYMTNYVPSNILNNKVSQEQIQKVKSGSKLVDKNILVICYKAHNRYVDDLQELGDSYKNVLKKSYFAFIFLILIQMFLLFKVLKQNKSL